MATKADQVEIAEQIQTFGENLRRARVLAGYTQVQLSVAAPLDRAAISRLECGERSPDLATLLRICSALGLSPRDLLSNVGRGTSLPHAMNQSQESQSGPGARFGVNLKWARDRAGISQERLALDAKVDRAAISVYENGGREPNLRTVLKLALKLEVQPGFLLDGLEAKDGP
jgi:transcriptional regulator with XRE-family HTH domain